MADYTDWPGKSGQTYRYHFADLAQPIVKAAGNYMFVKYTQSGWLPVYVGVAEDLSNRLANHERWKDAKAQGATHVMGHQNANAAARLAEERDLIEYWLPSCNTHHKPAA
jgi:hypothetical protein